MKPLAILLLCVSTAVAQYGSGVGADALNNTRIGGPWLSDADYAFRASHTGKLAAVRVYVIWSNTSAGYNRGTGGSLYFSVQTDANGKPSGSTLASALHSDPMSKGNFPLISFAPAKIEKGTLYHLVIQNPDANAGENYVSVNALWMPRKSSPRQPKFKDSDWFQLIRYSGGAWQSVEPGTESYTPIMELRYADGYVQGNSYMEVWTESPKRITGKEKVRQSFTPQSDKVLSAVTLRVRRVSGSAPLNVRLEKANGTLLESGTVTAGSEYAWVKHTFKKAQTLKKWTAYNLTLTAPSGTVYETYPIADGSSYGFTSGFTDGYAQFTVGSGWKGWDMWGQTDRRDSDLQFYFTTVNGRITDK